MTTYMTNEKAIHMTNDRVGYYWETEESYPVVEVFINGTEDEVINIKNELNNKAKEQDEMSEIVHFDHESFSDSYHRILYAFDFNQVSENVFSKVVVELEKFGESEYTMQ